MISQAKIKNFTYTIHPKLIIALCITFYLSFTLTIKQSDAQGVDSSIEDALKIDKDDANYHAFDFESNWQEKALKLIPKAPSDQEDYPDSYKNLSTKDKRLFIGYTKLADQAIKKMAIVDAELLIELAKNINDEHPLILNTEGLLHMKKKEYDKSATIYKKLLRGYPKLFAPRHNYAECFYASGDYASAKDLFVEILQDFPKLSDKLKQYLEFKVFVCCLRLGLNSEANAIFERFDRYGDTPAYYMARAAYLLNENVLQKDNPDYETGMEALKWLEWGKSIYRSNKNDVSMFLDTLIEGGLLQRRGVDN